MYGKCFYDSVVTIFDWKSLILGPYRHLKITRVHHYIRFSNFINTVRYQATRYCLIKSENCTELWTVARKSFFARQVWNLRQYSWNYFSTIMIFIRQIPKFEYIKHFLIIRLIIFQYIILNSKKSDSH